MLIIIIVFAMIVMTKQTKINNGESRRDEELQDEGGREKKGFPNKLHCNQPNQAIW